MRGKPINELDADKLSGITPAHAGKTLTYDKRYSFSWDHPRACGENQLRYICEVQSGGSPPRMRGKPADREIGHELTRITPAHAGKTK